MKKIFLLCSGAILFVSCYSIKSKPEEQTNVNNGLHLCQFDNHGKSFEILIPTQLRSSSYYSYPYHFDGLELCNEYLFLSGKDTCRLELNYWTGNFSSMDTTAIGLKKQIEKKFHIEPPKGKIQFYTITKKTSLFEIAHDEMNCITIEGYSYAFGLVEIKIKNCKDTNTTQKIINSMMIIKGKASIYF